MKIKVCWADQVIAKAMEIWEREGNKEETFQMLDYETSHSYCVKAEKELNKVARQMNKEIWKDIPGYKGSYQASDLGRIRSIDRYVKGRDGPSFRKGRILKPTMHKKGYWYVNICNYKNNNKFVHRLVALAFIENKDAEKYTVDHINENPLDNRAENLRYCSKRRNIHYYIKKRNKNHNLFHKKRIDKYFIRTCIDLISYELGGFKTKEEAIKVRDDLNENDCKNLDKYKHLICKKRAVN